MKTSKAKLAKRHARPGVWVTVKPGVYRPETGESLGIIRDVLAGGQAFGVRFMKHPHTVDYTARELRRAL